MRALMPNGVGLAEPERDQGGDRVATPVEDVNEVVVDGRDDQRRLRWSRPARVRGRASSLR